MRNHTPIAREVAENHLNHPYPERLARLKLPTLAFRRLRGDMIQVYRIMHRFADIQPCTLFDMEPKVGSLRGHNLKIQKTRCKGRIRRNCFSQRVVNIWNKLPGHVVSAKTTNSFKNAIDAYT